MFCETHINKIVSQLQSFDKDFSPKWMESVVNATKEMKNLTLETMEEELKKIKDIHKYLLNSIKEKTRNINASSL